MKHLLNCSYLSAALAAVTLTAGLHAQTAAPAPASKNAGEVVQLSEFQVAETSPNAYVASETMTGSRVNTKIVDLPYSIVNLTSEFFKDFAMDQLDENMTYIGGLTGINIGGSFNLRGVSATSQLRDGFYRLGRYGLSNIDRVEVIRGPMAAIYGRSSPGGMINFVGLSPKKQDEQSITVREGFLEQKKYDLQATGSLDSSAKTYYVLKIDQNNRAFPGNSYSEIHNNEGYLAVEHDFSSTSHLRVSAEYYLQIQHAAQAAPPIISQARTATPDNSATSTVIGYDNALAYINPYGPRSELNRGSDTFEATYDNQLTDVWSTRIGAYKFGARRWDFNNNGWGAITLPVSPTGAVTTTRSSVPGRGEIMEDGGGFQADLVAHYFLANHKVEAKTLFTVDLNDYYRWDPSWTMPSNDPAVVAWGAAGSGRVVTLVPGSIDGVSGLVPNAPLTYFPTSYNPGNLTLSTLTRRRTTSLGGNIRQQMFFFDNRLIAYAGLRNDNVLFSQRDYTVAFASVGVGPFPAGQGGAGQPGGSVVRRYVHQNKPNLGFNYAVTPSGSLRLYSSYSEAYFVDQTSRPAVIAASTYAPFTSKGIDYGFKGSFLDGKLNFTLGGYYTRQYNVLVNDEVETPPGSGIFVSTAEQDGDQLIRGWESDLSYVITDSTSMVVSFGRADSKYTYFGSANPDAIGRSVANITPENGGASLLFNPRSGFLKGFSANLGVTYVASTPTQSPTAGDTLSVIGGKAVVTGHTDAWKLRLPAFTLWTAGLHYRLPRLNSNWNQDISLNVVNIFDKRYLKTSTLAGDPSGVLFTYQLTHAGSRF